MDGPDGDGGGGSSSDVDGIGVGRRWGKGRSGKATLSSTYINTVVIHIVGMNLRV